MLLVGHLNVFSCTALWVLFEELRVSAFEEVDLLIKDFRVVLNMKVSVNFSQRFIQEWSSFLAELAMENNRSAVKHHLLNEFFIFEKGLLNLFWVCEILGTDDVTALEFVIKPTVDDHCFSARF